MADPFGQALLDAHRGTQTEPLLQRDGEETMVHHVEDYYFNAFESQPSADWLRAQLAGPLLDLGAGAGRDTLYFQDQFETVACDVSPALVTLLAERGVDQVTQGDLFALREQFDRDRFRSVLIAGTQTGLVKSMQGLRSLLGDLAYITGPDATVVLDSYDPTRADASKMLGYRSDPTRGLAFRVVQYAYGDLTESPRLFRLFSPQRIAEATTGTGWERTAVRRPGESYYYRIALQKA